MNHERVGVVFFLLIVCFGLFSSATVEYIHWRRVARLFDKHETDSATIIARYEGRICLWRAAFTGALTLFFTVLFFTSASK